MSDLWSLFFPLPYDALLLCAFHISNNTYVILSSLFLFANWYRELLTIMMGYLSLVPPISHGKMARASFYVIYSRHYFVLL